MNSGTNSEKPVEVKAFTQESDDISWYCEMRGNGPVIVLIPSGEGDCGSFEKVADNLADEYTVLTFDMPGFSRSSTPPEFGDVTADMLGEWISGLVKFLGITSATFYGCSSAGQAVLSLVADHPDIVRNGIVHEAALLNPKDICWPEEMAGILAHFKTMDDAAVSAACADFFRNGMNHNPQAWDDLGKEYHMRLEKNFVTWVKHYGMTVAMRSYNADELIRKPIAWSVGGYSETWAMTGNICTAQRANIDIVYLRSKHFPQVSIPEELMVHIRENTKKYL